MLCSSCLARMSDSIIIALPAAATILLETRLRLLTVDRSQFHNLVPSHLKALPVLQAESNFHDKCLEMEPMKESSRSLMQNVLKQPPLFPVLCACPSQTQRRIRLSLCTASSWYSVFHVRHTICSFPQLLVDVVYHVLYYFVLNVTKRTPQNIAPQTSRQKPETVEQYMWKDAGGSSRVVSLHHDAFIIDPYLFRAWLRFRTSRA